MNDEQRKAIFVTVGTSALSARELGSARGPGFDLGRMQREALQKRARSVIDGKEKKPWDRFLVEVSNAHRAHWAPSRKPGEHVATLRQTSAEMTSTYLLTQPGKDLPGALRHGRDRIVLLSSDTDQGWFCARVNAILMREVLFGCTETECGHKCVEKERVEGLEGNKNTAQTIPTIRKIVNPYRRDGWTVYFNITGGYKGAVPAITWLCSETPVIPMYFFHESASQAVRLTPLEEEVVWTPPRDPEDIG